MILIMLLIIYKSPVQRRQQFKPRQRHSVQLKHQLTLYNTASERVFKLEFFPRYEMTLPSRLETVTANKQFSFKEELRHYIATTHSNSNFREYWYQNEIT